MAAKGVPVHVYGDWDGRAIGKAKQDLSVFQREATGFSGAIGKSFLGMGAAIGGAFAIGSVISSVTTYLQDAATAAMQDEKSMVALAKAMDNVGQGFANADAEKFISDLMLATGTADDQLRPALQRLITATGDTAKAQNLLTTALDISAATGRDVVSVSQALSRASTGQLSALTRLGVPLDANIVKTKDFGAAIDSLNQRFGGQAAAAADTYGGQLARLQVAAGEAQETIGYALLDAVENVTDAFGGAGGFQEVILEAGDYAANLVAGLGQAVSALADLAAGAQDVEVGVGGAGMSLADMGREAVLALPGIGLQLRAIGALAQSGEDYRLEQERVNESLRASEALYAGYAASSDSAAVAQRGVEMSAQDTEDALKALREEVQAIQGVISDSQAWDNFRRSLMDLNETLKGNARNFSNLTEAGRENRDTLRELFSDAAERAAAWAEKTGASTEEFQRKFDGLAKKVVDQFVRDGFKREDVERFLGQQGIWVSAITALSGTVTEESRKLGVNASKGIASGIRSAESSVATAMSATVLSAIRAGKDAAKIQSPSQVTRDEVGVPIIDGIIAGMNLKKEELKSATQTVVGDALNAAKGIISGWDAEIANRLGDLESSTAAITNWVTSTKNQLVSAFDLAGVFESSIDKQGKMTVSTFQSGIEAGLAEFKWYTDVLTAISQTPGSEQLVAFLQNQGVTTGGTWGQALIDNGLVQYMVDNLGTVTTTADTTAKALVPPFLLAAQQSSQALYDQYVKDYGKGGEKREKLEGLMDRLAKSLDRTATITIKTVYEAAGIDGKRAAGGPVTANKAYLVGERGPEVLVMGSQSGTIIPNGDLPMASGSVRGGDGASMSAPVVINVNAGMGTDGAEVGRQVVDALKAYSRRNGPLPLAVA